jgi:very-short-patch-repair endonuclease/DNA polymerase III delta prime subunit
MESERQIGSELERARRNLLELTTRNRLLHIPTSARARLIWVAGELGPATYGRLVGERKAFTFGALPETAEEAEEDAESEMEQPAEGGWQVRHDDLELQTLLTSKALQGRLLTLHVNARTHLEDQGVNVLYLAFGLLRWTEDERSEETRLAPLILVPVTLERASAGSRFKVKRLEEDPSGNLTLQARLAEFGLKLPIPEIDDDFDLAAYFEEVARLVAPLERWSVEPDAMVLGLFSFSTFLMYRDLEPSNWPEEAALERHPLVRSLLAEGFSEPADVPDPRADLDELISIERLNHVVDADSSQTLAIEAVRRGNHLIIQGPPGTGKSQTIANLIATAVLDGKRVLFVAEKMAALEVVRRRLEEIGLGRLALEVHSHKTTRKSFLEELRKALHEEVPVFDEARPLLGQLEAARERLNEHARLLNTLMEPAGWTPYQVIGHLSLLTRRFPGEPPPLLAGAETWTPQEQEARSAQASRLGAHLQTMVRPDAHPWRGVQSDPMTRFELDTVGQRVAALRIAFGEMQAAMNALAELLQRPPPTHLAEVSEVHALGAAVLAAPVTDEVDPMAPLWEDQVQAVRELVAALEGGQALQDELRERFVAETWEAPLPQIRQTVAAHGNRWFRFLNAGYRRAVATLRGLHKDPSRFPKSFAERLHLLDGMVELQSYQAHVAKAEALGREAMGAAWKGMATHPVPIRRWLDWLAGLESPAQSRHARAVLARRTPAEDLTASLQLSRETARSFEDGWSELQRNLALDHAAASGVATLSETPMVEIRAILARWAANHAALDEWIQYHAMRGRALEGGLQTIVETLEDWQWPPAEALALYQLAYFRTLFDFIMRQHPELRAFDGAGHAQLIDQFREKDAQRIEIARLEVLAAHAASRPSPHGGHGAVGIVLGEIAKKRRHMPIRRLISMAGEAVQAIKPVFMMSPLSVAQFLEPGRVTFDLVVFDEASQVKPVDALGAVARGRQLVVVGDDKQLPPTNFFSRIEGVDGLEEDELEDLTASAGDMESVLSLAAARGLHSTMLRWHYRSRHGSLIAVSNHEFYEKSLYIVPSPQEQHANYGLKFCHVPEGVYRRGGRRQDNPIEATRVAEAVMEHALNHPGQSLGVAAFSMSQRDAILNELERLRRQHPERERFFSAAHPHEPFFVKNLENVQGDERDVIYISVGYGKDANGYFAMNFGPINREGGERRLNVLITRSKLRCVVFSSIRADEIDLERSKARGTRALKTFLKYAETGILGTADPHTGREPDSPFEVAVMEALEGEGYTVRPQVGVAGFFIDLAVVDPASPGRYLLGVECDGAAYHSSRSARERDRQRQAVLEAHGWTLHRIWSTDWFKAPERELRKLLKALAEAPASGSPKNRPRRPATPLSVEWKPAGADSGAPMSLPDYVECALPMPSAPFAALTTGELGEVVYQVVEVEGPVHVEEVILRIRDSWQMGRAGPRIREAIMAAVAALRDERLVAIDGEFISLPQRSPSPRNRAKVTTASLKRAERLPPAEIAAVLQRAVSDFHGIERAEVAGTVARLMGMGRTTQECEAVVQHEVETLLATGDLVERDGFLRQG